MREKSILEPGRNCWRRERSERIALLVDGAEYFAALRSAALRATRSLFIVGWDVDSRVLVPRVAESDDLPEPLGEFLDALARRTPRLRIYVLDWDYAVLYTGEREFLPVLKFDWRTHPRVHFRLDDAHPIGASHHQKIVVVDDALAFVGGLDLALGRYDTSEHAPEEPLRLGHDGEQRPPFHDLMLAVDGTTAVALGELVRERWRRATGSDAEVDAGAEGGESDPWPPALTADATDVPVAIARTLPEYESQAAVHEIRQLYLDAIEGAQERLYLENQYFTADCIVEAMARSLKRAEGPEIVLVSRESDSGWLEETTMGVLRARRRRFIDHADAHDRFQVFYPVVPELTDSYVNVHAKLLIADDDLFTVGSANLTNRSMGLDTECNLAIDAAGDERLRAVIRGFRQRLLAEHLDMTPKDVAATEERTESLLGTIAKLQHDGRTLAVLKATAASEAEPWVPTAIVDPEHPVAPERVLTELLPQEQSSSALGRVVAAGTLLAAFLALAAAWRWSRLGEWLDVDALMRGAEALERAPATPFAVLAVYVIAGLFVIPVTLLITITGAAFGAWPGLAYALGGSLLSALSTYGLGHVLGRKAVKRLAGSRLGRLSEALGRRGLSTVVLVRLIPVAPFSVINLIAGASHIRLRDFLLGTLIGLAPGTIAIVVFVDRAKAAVTDPSWSTLSLLVVVLVAIVGGAIALRRRLRKRAAS